MKTISKIKLHSMVRNSIIIILGFQFSIKAQSGAALNFDGVNDNVKINCSTMGAFTIEFWMRTTQVGPIGAQWWAGAGLVDAEVGGAANDYGTSLLGNKLAFGTGNPDVTITSTTNVNTGNWIHVAAAFTSNPDGKMWLYINGVLEAFIDPGVSSNARNTNANIAFGSIQTNVRYFNGDIDEVRIWSSTLSQCEIQSRMNCEIASPLPGLIYYYQFNQGIAAGTNTAITTATNFIGGNNGSLNNFAKVGATSNFIAPGGVVSGLACPTIFVNVQGNGNNVVDGAVTSTTLNNTNYGNVCANAMPVTHTFAVQNNLMVPLSLGAFTITGANASSFSVSSLPSSTIAPSGSSNFAVTFSPSTVGVKTAALSFTTNNCNTTIYNYALGATVVGIPTITVNNGTICSGNSFVIIPSGAITYTFSGGSATVSPVTTTAYTVTGTNTLGCVNSNTAVSNVSVTSTPTINVNSGSVCIGNSFTISPTGAAAYTFIGGGPIVTPSITSTYSVVGSNASCVSVNTVISTVTVNALPIVTIVTTNSILCVGQTAILTASGANTYSWNTGSTAGAIAISPTINTTFSVSGTDLNGCKNVSIITQSISLCTSIGSVSLLESSGVLIYPNPSNGLINIELNTNAEIELADVNGKNIIKENLVNEKNTIDLQNFSEGIYFLSVKISEKTLRQKIIIQK